MRTLAAAHTPAEVAALTIPLSDGRRVRLDQIARISDSHTERSTLAYVDGKEVIGFQITRQKGFSDVSVREALREAVSRFATAHPQVKISEVALYGRTDRR